jgi:hypothetical protein
METLEVRHCLAADPIVSEVLTDNSGGLLDEDGDDPDWIELYNRGDATWQAEGWYLTDDPGNLDKWRLPSAAVEPGEFLVVFASGKDRAVSGSPWHTSFQLANGEESVYLVRPDGVTVASAIDPLPWLPENTSYGVEQRASAQTLVAAGATGRFLVPSTGNGGSVLGESWRGGDESFDDTGWLEVRTGVGFSDTIGVPATVDWSLEEGAGTVAVDASGNGNNATLNGPAWNGTDLPPTGSSASLEFDGISDTVSADDYQGLLGNAARTVSAWIKTTKVPANGTYAPTLVHWGGAGNGGRFTFRLNENASNGTVGGLRVEVAGGYIVGTVSLTDGQWHHVAATFDPNDGPGVRSVKLYVDGVPDVLSGQGADVAIATALGDRVTVGYGPAGTLNRYFEGLMDNVAIYDVALSADRIAVLSGGGGNDPLITTDVAAQMRHENATSYLRVPFLFSGSADRLSLRMNYNDGFIAYLNGMEVARQNAPVQAAFDAAATSVHDAQQVELFDIPISEGVLRDGENVLAIHGLNRTASDGDFLVLPVLEALGVVETTSSVGHFSVATPGGINGEADVVVQHQVTDVAHSPREPSSEDDLVVTARVEGEAALAAVSLVYRVMYGAETSLTMLDDGSGSDVEAGDGVYTGVIPATAYGAGEMVRWYVVAESEQGVASRYPLWADEVVDRTAAPEYFGTMIVDDSVDSQLPVLYWFLAPGTEQASRTRTGTRASVYFAGQLYDNVFVRVRGGTTASLSKNSYKIDFNPDHHFRFDPALPRVSEINLNTTFTDKAYIRQNLSYEVYDIAGSPGSLAFPMRIQRNGDFHSVAMFVEQPDEDMLRREGLDPNGALYKMFNTFTSASTVEKKTRRSEPNTDLAEFIAEINGRTGTELRDYVFDHVNIPAVLNYLAATVITQNDDQQAKNYYLYRDTEGTGEWMFLPWDLDLTFGLHFMTNDSVLDDEIWADEDNILGGAGNNVPISPSHPYVGEQEHPANRNWNRLIDKLYEIPEFREMYLRRLRSLMDEVLQAPGTATEELYLDQRLDEWLDVLQADASLDKTAWANPWSYGADLTMSHAIERIKTEYLAVRRTHLYETHSIDAIDMSEPVVLLEADAEAKYFVPADNSLGSSWIAPEFDDTTWQAGAGGFGFEDGTSDFDGIINTEVRPNQAAGGTSVYLRYAMELEDASAIDELYLSVRYDDAFVLYLNGVEVSRQFFFAGTPAYNSRAIVSRVSSLALTPQLINLSSRADVLVSGENTIAVHLMNFSATNSDLLFEPVIYDRDPNGPEATSVGIPRAQDAVPHLQFGAFDAAPGSGNQDEEYIEIVNANDTSIDIAGWRLTGGVEYTFGPGTIVRGNSNLFVSPDVSTFRARSSGPSGGMGLLVQGPYRGHLSNLGETVRLIRPDGSVAASFATPDERTDAQRYLRISEVHYNPTDVGDGSEFIELTSVAPAGMMVDLGGIVLSDGPSEPLVIPAGMQIAGGEYRLMVKDLAAFMAAYPLVDAALIVGEFAGSLNNAGERIKLDDALGNTIVEFSYGIDDPWPRRSDGAGASLELRPAAAADAELSTKGASWQGSYVAGGSPGLPTSEAVGVIISEIIANSPDSFDAIELRNVTSSAIDISGWYLSDTAQDLRKYQIPAGTVLGPGAYVVFDERQFNPTPESPAAHHFGLDGTRGDDVWLVQLNPLGQVHLFSDDVHFGAMLPGQTWGVTEESLVRLTPLSRNTLGCRNSAAAVSDSVVLEIMYEPAAPTASAMEWDSSLDANDLEYLVIGATPAALSDWRLRGGVDFDFPTSTVESGPTWVVSFDPQASANQARLRAFLAHYDLDDSISIVGGYAGSLSNQGEIIRLQRPGDRSIEEPDIQLYVTVDEIAYDNLAPWPAIEAGESLVRRAPVFFGNLANSWVRSGTVINNRSGDFNGDGSLDAADIDQLFDAIHRQSQQSYYALTGGELPSIADVDRLLELMGNRSRGDANLDGSVDGIDLDIWNDHAFAGCGGWSTGDFDGDGSVDGRDFNWWNANKFHASGMAAAVTGREPRAAHSRQAMSLSGYDDEGRRDIRTDHDTAEPVGGVGTADRDQTRVLFERNALTMLRRLHRREGANRCSLLEQKEVVDQDSQNAHAMSSNYGILSPLRSYGNPTR